MCRNFVAVCVLCGFSSSGVAQDPPIINIHANAFETLEMMLKLRDFKAKIIVTPKKTEPEMSLSERVKKDMKENFILMIFDIHGKMIKEKSKLADRLDAAFGLSEEARKQAIMMTIEEYLKIQHDGRPLLERSERIVWEWLKCDSRISILEEKKTEKKEKK